MAEKRKVPVGDDRAKSFSISLDGKKLLSWLPDFKTRHPNLVDDDSTEFWEAAAVELRASKLLCYWKSSGLCWLRRFRSSKIYHSKSSSSQLPQVAYIRSKMRENRILVQDLLSLLDEGGEGPFTRNFVALQLRGQRKLTEETKVWLAKELHTTVEEINSCGAYGKSEAPAASPPIPEQPPAVERPLAPEPSPEDGPNPDFLDLRGATQKSEPDYFDGYLQAMLDYDVTSGGSLDDTQRRVLECYLKGGDRKALIRAALKIPKAA